MSLLIGEIFRRNAQTVPTHVAAAMGSKSLCFGELDAAGNRLARFLAAQGVAKGDRVVSWADTSLDVLPLFAALAKLGAVFAPLNARLGAEEATAVAQLARPKLFVADAAHAVDGERLAEASGSRGFARIGGDVRFGLDLTAEAFGGASAEPVQAPDLDERDPHVIFFTSGSTGASKGVVLSHRANYLRSFQGVFRDVPEHTVCMFPLFHMAAFSLALAAWQTRGKIVFVETASADEILGAVEKHRANRLYCIPAVFARILEADPAAYDTSSLAEVDTGTSATPPELVAALKKRFPNTATRIYYGSTECGAGTVLPAEDVLRKPGSVGVAAPGSDLKLTASGEICVRSDYLMDGYFEAPEATAEVLRDGWYHTGDLGALDDEGFLSIVGRLKDIIRSGGESIAPTEVEEALCTHPELADVAVVGVPDAQWGEIVCAVVVPIPGANPSLELLQQHCEGRLAPFKRPRRIECVEALPRTAATGQVQRALLVERIATGSI
jgi:fatty-acyl-CoA synthase